MESRREERVKAVVDRFVKELKEVLEFDGCECRVAGGEAGSKAELSRREANPQRARVWKRVPSPEEGAGDRDRGEGLQTHGNTEAHVTCSSATHRVQSSSDEKRGAYDGTIQKSDGGDSKRTNGKDGRGSVAGIPKLLSQVRLVSLAASNTHTSKNTWRPKPLALHGTRSHLTGHSIFKAKKENQGHVSLLKHIQASNEKEDENIAKWQAGKAHVMLVNNENGGVFSNIKDNEDVNIKIKVNDELNGNTKKQLTAYSNPGKRINEDGEIVDDFIDKRLEREIDMEMQEMGKAQLSGDGSMHAKDPMDITSEDFSEENNPITPSNDSCAEGPEILADRKYIGRHEDNNMGLTPNLEKSPTSQGLSNTPQLSQERLPHTPNKLQAWEGILAGTIPVGQGAMEEGTLEGPHKKKGRNIDPSIKYRWHFPKKLSVEVEGSRSQ
ncbi:hypothetical protein J5N97_018526 [Dioscorea zingiberensis]|uniref:Uncharacterized protein n=1 Tax=Dioscorea zingiberensis TaxID=325984 RepID=A0A9D5CC99_9LILI|nr:hypothetical protein J5N97_018526 [Dioscorea zingiberensis]